MLDYRVDTSETALYYNNSERFYTDSLGVSIKGTAPGTNNISIIRFLDSSGASQGFFGMTTGSSDMTFVILRFVILRKHFYQISLLFCH